MARRIVVALTFGALALSGAFVAAQQTTQTPPKPQIKSEAITPTSPSDAKFMFQEYCAACHGNAGKGDGPAAVALKKLPPDLTGISARNGGVFPAAKISRYIQGADEIAAHGNREMPVWGPAFKSLAGGTGTEALRIKNLTDYLKSIQK